MNIEILNRTFFQELTQIVCKTLLHSIWQGLLLAVVAGVVLMATKKSRPALRYNLLSLALLIFVFANAFTFFLEFSTFRRGSSHSFSNTTSIGEISKLGNNAGFRNWYELSAAEVPVSFFNNFIAENAALIVVIWLLVFSYKSVRAAGGLFFIYRLKTSGKSETEEVWKNRLEILAEKLGLKRKIQFFQSGQIDVPIVTGILKPVVFVPLGFFTNLTHDQIEAILLHELAHVKRRDYLINLIQTFGENIYFFNPAVLWISSLIRDEREHCCDDLAISVLQNQQSFVEALVYFQEYKMYSASSVMAFNGRRNHLLDRVKRIIYKNNKSLNAMEKLFVTASLLTATFLIAAFSPSANVTLKMDNAKKQTELFPATSTKDAFLARKKESGKLAARKPEITVLEINNNIDTLPGKYDRIQINSGVSNIETTKNNKRYEIQEVDGQLRSLKVDGEAIPEDKFGIYQKELNEISSEVKEQRENAEIARKDAEKARGEAEILRKQADGMRIEAEKMKEAAGKMREQAAGLKALADVSRQHAEEARGLAETARIEAGKHREDAESMRKIADLNREQAAEHRKLAEEHRKLAEVSRKQAEVNRAAFQKLQEELIDDLIKEGVIKDENNLSYKLNSDELVVNGVKQAPAVHQKFKHRYVKEAGWETIYNTNGRTGINIKK
ncbi:BlaR1 peptidase M56 [Dyadobacter koreensis]|uniref:BlaR1 peptidase M56 n=1 Tax=Dyadobacter koreensis TaxID=408657 RepID=A0A1H6V7Q0_9BACT|nr:M56 family metallopeptidase [Dyadobacter koreensis]SEI99836.1 BlaR1 peptidase M56 [Dyadobacter koreensis]